MAYLGVHQRSLFWLATVLAFSRSCDGQENTTLPLPTVPSRCKPIEFECANGLCIPGSRYCDSWNDCLDGSDERNCPRPPTTQCSRLQFPCNDGHCIILRFRCNGFEDCPDGSDEINCPLYPMVCLNPLFRCENGRCIDKSFVCDGKDNCKDMSDEIHCDDVPSGSPQNSGPSSTSHLLYHDARYQAATYTIIGCTVAFVAVVVCFVITVHRIKRRQEALRTPPRQRQDIARDYRRGMFPSQNQMPYFIQSSGYRRASGNYLVTYNINNGVQIISNGLVKPYDAPPKYSDIVGGLEEESPDSPGSPPPPYSEVEQPLLMRLDTGEHQQEEEAGGNLQVLLVSGRGDRDFTVTPGQSGEVVCQRTEEAVPMLAEEGGHQESSATVRTPRGSDSNMTGRAEEPPSDQHESCSSRTQSEPETVTEVQ
ncbi:PREDICTED: low-density lipoprotein receptor class A domain-containing protein 3-like [Branchiostoma belcheri]|uniref:Low-density lipoprotein receptor class A domain-containing protein 3-like n=1 Tax=Branchiostoma belcheri TaxID=7741 RepID=A0A6P5A4Y7_BRABE|nr:PREDICTED: low-density lipoprotein receptor class A domain-containing protein 3-like [Branchiostoma belcheri]